MANQKAATKSVDDYIEGFPDHTRAILNKVRRTIRKAARSALETISYGMPAFCVNDTYLVYFGGYKKHLSLYPVPKGTQALTAQMKPLRAGQGTLRFPLDRPISYQLIARIVRALLKENAARAGQRRQRGRATRRGVS